MSKEYWIPISKSMNASEKSYAYHIGKGIDDQLRKTSEWLSTSEAEEMFQQKRNNLDTYLEESELHTDLDSIIHSNASDSEDYVNKMYVQGAKKGCRMMMRNLAFTQADKEALFYLKNYNFSLIKNLQDDVKNKIKEHLTMGVIEGSDTIQIRDNLMSIPLKPINNISPKARATMIARTEYARARITGTLQSYQNYGVEMVEVITANDSSVCDICIDISEKNPYNINDVGSLPPFHPNCRCTVSALTGLSEYQNAPLENPNVVNLTPSNPKNSQKLDYESLETVEDMQKFFGLKYKYGEYEGEFGEKKEGHIFYDSKNKCEIRIDNKLLNKGLKYYKENWYEGELESISQKSMKSMLRDYHYAPPKMKKVTDIIEYSNDTDSSALGFWHPSENFKNPTRQYKSNIVIPRNCFDDNAYWEDGKLVVEDKSARTLYHEMGHSLDAYLSYQKMKEKYYGKLDCNLSRTKGFRLARQDDRIKYCSSYGEDSKKGYEEVAEIMSLVAFKNNPLQKEHHYFASSYELSKKLNDGYTVLLNYEDLKKYCPNRVKWAEELVFGE